MVTSSIFKEFRFEKTQLDEKLKQLALKFYHTFKDTFIPVKIIKPIFKEVNSITIHVKGNTGVDLPHWFIRQLELPGNSPDFNSITTKTYNWIDTISYLYEESFTRKHPLIQVDIDVIRGIYLDI